VAVRGKTEKMRLQMRRRRRREKPIADGDPISSALDGSKLMIDTLWGRSRSDGGTGARESLCARCLAVAGAGTSSLRAPARDPFKSLNVRSFLLRIVSPYESEVKVGGFVRWRKKRTRC
jgi:hypothetical protein